MNEAQPPSDEACEDEELLKLSVKKPRSVVMALSVIGLVGLVSYALRADLRFAFRSKTPRLLGDLRHVSGVRGLDNNEFVTLEGIPDRRNALFIEERGARTRETFFRLLGTEGPIFVRALDATGRTDLEDRFTGRLRRFDSQPYAETLRAYFAKETHGTRSLDLKGLRRRLETGEAAPPGELHDRSGRTVSISSDTPLRVTVLFFDSLLVRAAKNKFSSAEDAQQEIERLGFTHAPAPAPALSRNNSYAFILPASASERNQVAAKLEGAGLVFSAHEEQLATTWRALSARGPLLKVGEREVFWPSVQSIAFEEPIAVGGDALILTEGEKPGDFWWVPLVQVLLIAFALFNLWYLALAFRKPT